MTAVEKVLARSREDPDVVAVFLFGSQARDESTAGSDVDLCLLLRPESRDASALFEKKLGYLREGDVDVNIFSELPLYIRHRVLREGKVLFCKDEDLLYELAFRTARAFEDFRHIYRGYLEEVARARS